jgi:phosphoribosylanthranilate isomerase
MVPKVKICCISSVAEASLAINSGADAIGLVGPMPSGPGVISNETASIIASAVSSNAETFLLTSETNAESVVAHHKQVNTSTIQIVDDLKHGTHLDIKNELPHVKLVQVVHVLEESSLEKALAAAETSDVVLLDSGNPNLTVKELGGTGRIHNWEISRKIVEQAKKPVFLAGGLNPENVSRAIEEVGPFGIDLCSGVRTKGLLDPEKLEKFMRAIQNGKRLG